MDQALDADIQALQVNQGVGDKLAGTMPGDLAATVGLDQGRCRGFEQVTGVAVQSQGIYGRMLQQPELIRR